MAKIAIIGAGISGLCAAHLLSKNNEVTVFEKEDRPGGLIKCHYVNGSLFHTCGGHVFNSKRHDVLDWFWSNFQCEQEFLKANRNSMVLIENTGAFSSLEIPYPIENHMYLFDAVTQKKIIDDLISMAKNASVVPHNFEEFLRSRFGDTLYSLYFQPYNEKIWRRSLCKVPLSWLEGKLPMPTVAEMIYNNINHIEERTFVHATFWYEKMHGSQYIADKLAEKMNIVYNTNVASIEYDNKTGGWIVCNRLFDKVVFCGNIKDMPKVLKGIDINEYVADINTLEYHGTTAVFCEIDKNPYSWIYLPSKNHESHRIICTGNFAESNNAQLPKNRTTATIEFTDDISKEEILDNLKRIPFNPKYLEHKYTKYTYPIQDNHTRDMVIHLKNELALKDFYFTGRFADWEYYNMDIAMGAAMDMVSKYKL